MCHMRRRIHASVFTHMCERRPTCTYMHTRISTRSHALTLQSYTQASAGGKWCTGSVLDCNGASYPH